MIFSQRRLRKGLLREQQLPRWPYGFREWPPGSFDWIVDLGANCGMVTIALRMLFPRASIVAVEPHPDNFRALAANCAGLNIQTLQAALSTTATIDLQCDRFLGCSRVLSCPTRPAGVITVPGITFSGLLERFGICGRIGVKMDIEGGERLFLTDEAETERLKSCAYLGCELHYPASDYRDWIGSLGEVVHVAGRWRRTGYAEVVIQ